jgi:hypothetical protein
MTRTKSQNDALHLYLREVSEALNAAGYDMKKTLKPEIEIPWDADGRMAKEHIWRPVQKIMTDIESTTDLDKKDVSAIYEVISRHLAEKFGVSVEFPSDERLAAMRVTP